MNSAAGLSRSSRVGQQADSRPPDPPPIERSRVLPAAPRPHTPPGNGSDTDYNTGRRQNRSRFPTRSRNRTRSYRDAVASSSPTRPPRSTAFLHKVTEQLKEYHYTDNPMLLLDISIVAHPNILQIVRQHIAQLLAPPSGSTTLANTNNNNPHPIGFLTYDNTVKMFLRHHEFIPITIATPLIVDGTVYRWRYTDGIPPSRPFTLLSPPAPRAAPPAIDRAEPAIRTADSVSDASSSDGNADNSDDDDNIKAVSDMAAHYSSQQQQRRLTSASVDSTSFNDSTLEFVDAASSPPFAPTNGDPDVGPQQVQRPPTNPLSRTNRRINPALLPPLATQLGSFAQRTQSLVQKRLASAAQNRQQLQDDAEPRHALATLSNPGGSQRTRSLSYSSSGRTPISSGGPSKMTTRSNSRGPTGYKDQFEREDQFDRSSTTGLDNSGFTDLDQSFYDPSPSPFQPTHPRPHSGDGSGAF
ncbi:hypothetical protein GGI18_001930 [Coemansia linderi]|uniref:Uncharacterized protein n=1 Tax=Coemansia linderi TaxID=2663919 RepID=A0ACC1KIA8_9FUNG|nr:hypothetical protein GGI18_001930 [Coemansia linderi]